MGFNEMPVEIFEMIVKNTAFVDLPYLLQVSKRIPTFFKTTKFAHLLEFIPTDKLKEMHSQMSQFPKIWEYWSTENVLTEYAKPCCKDCGDFGFYFMWICFPAKKLCSHCLFTNPGYAHVGLNEGRKFCGLTPWDVEGLPTINIVKDSTKKRPSVLSIVLRNTLTLVALEKGLSPPHIKEFGGKPYRYATWSDCVLLGCVRVSGMLDADTGKKFEEITCGHCEPVICALEGMASPGPGVIQKSVSNLWLEITDLI